MLVGEEGGEESRDCPLTLAHAPLYDTGMETKQRLTPEQMDAVIERANMAPKHKEALREQIKTEPGARLAVYGLWLRQGKPALDAR